MEDKELFNKMTKVVGELLEGNYFSAEEKDKIETSFIDGFYSVLRVAFDVTVNDRMFREFVDGGKQDDPVERAKFLITTLDNEKTYKLMNYYLMNFLISYGKGVDESSKSRVQMILASENLVPNGFASVTQNYRNLINKS